VREAFHEQLESITNQLVEMTRLAGSAMARATTALLDADLHLAEDVITGDRALDSAREHLDALAVDLLARQQPVATDLRTVVTALRMSSDLDHRRSRCRSRPPSGA
jgi:phosphate transport system protein